MDDTSEKSSLALFFDERASAVGAVPTREDLCFASGRDPRLWSDDRLYEDLLQSICEQAGILPEHSILEVGCAAGFLAQGLAPRCRSYTGVDLAPAAVARARSLGIPNARFEVADATALPLASDEFDVAVSYDVFTNFDGFDLPRAIMEEMVRVVKPGGTVLIGSVPDLKCREEYELAVARVGVDLEERCGPPPSAPVGHSKAVDRIRHWYRRRVQGVRPAIQCYYFNKSDFEEFGRAHHLSTRLDQIHRLNPYAGLRFNVVFRRPLA